MPVLMLLRHAKSSWDDAPLSDFDRPLAARGKAAAPAMARHMAAKGWLPDSVLVSPARRTCQTYELMTGEWRDHRPASEQHRIIYEGDAADLLALIKGRAAQANTLLLVGHNPALHELAASLSGAGSDADAATRMTARFPTCALARFTLPDWHTLEPGQAGLTDYVVPRDLPTSGSEQ